MKSLRKSILTLLALTLFGGAGAWAQGPTQVTEITTDMIASWQDVGSDLTLADLQALGFVAVDESVAHAWTGAPTSGYAYLIYGFNEGSGSLMYMPFNHGNVGEPAQGSITKGGFYDMIAYGEKWFYTGSPAIELTKAGANQWSLGQAPDYDLELQVEYYEAHALKDIPAGWTVKINGIEQPKPYQGDSLMITETDTVTLEPAGNPRRVKSVTLEDAPTPLDNTTTAWADGKYAVPAGGLTYSAAVTVSGNVTLVLTTGTTLTLNKGISLASGATLTIQGNGTMNVNGSNGNTSSTVAGSGTLVLTSGTLNAKGGTAANVAQYGTSSNAGGVAVNGSVTVNGGILNATGGVGGSLSSNTVNARAGAGGTAISGNVTVNAGTVTATGGNGGSDAAYAMGAHAGDGGAAIGGNATITGGTWTATDGSAGAKVGDSTVGAGGKAVAGTVTDNR